MARNLNPKCKQCRREGKKLFLKGERCYSPKCSMVRRPYAPGAHGAKRRRAISEYGAQLREKQKIKRIYGLLEKQFRKYFQAASAKKENINQAFLTILETRLDNAVYRSGFDSSRVKARQLVTHGHFTVNGRLVNIPSYQVKEGDLIATKEQSKNKIVFKEIEKTLKGYDAPAWILLNKEKLEAKITGLPLAKEVDLGADIKMVVEHYSR
jgi:small subunit ribosomal protein S4